LVLANIRQVGDDYVVDELAVATEHAPFRHRQAPKEVGEQRKRAKLEASVDAEKSDAE
jgi:hypothetical protein